MEANSAFKRLTTLTFCIASLFNSACTYTCEKRAAQCETSLIITQLMSMMHNLKAVYPSNGKIYYADVTNTTEAQPVPLDEVITLDGWENNSLVIVANGSMPGPPIIAFEGQTLIVHVVNKLQSDSVTIHWHGLPMRDNPYMDGSAFVTQCPILPGQTFTYKFKASLKGTHFYHSHIGMQRIKGLHGPLIVRPQEETDMKEHTLTIQDWNHDWDGDMDLAKALLGAYENRKHYIFPTSIDGSLHTFLKIHSGLINGRGRYHDPQSKKHNEAPLAVFEVEQGHTYRFRIIGAGNGLPFRISVDGHKMLVVSSDGYDIEPVTAHSLIIQPGERYDIFINANQSVSNYWIRGEAFEMDIPKNVEAILRYVGATDEEPNTSKHMCTSNKRCITVNCAFAYYHENEYTDCINFDQLKSNLENDPAPEMKIGKFHNIFANLAFTPFPPALRPSINGKSFILPSVSAMSQPKEVTNLCRDNVNCREQKTCFCTNTIDIDNGNTVQVVLSTVGTAGFTTHPVHLHGYSFYVVKTGFAKFNRSTGQIVGDNEDIDCGDIAPPGQNFCNNPTWKNGSWINGDIPGLELNRPPRKDTITVPSGGYTIIRFRADNPGVWLLHCHIKVHFAAGMALLFNDSFPDQSPPPEGFPECYGYPRQCRVPPMTTDKPKSIEVLKSTSPHQVVHFTWSFTTSVSVLLLLEAFLFCLQFTQDEISPLRIIKGMFTSRDFWLAVGILSAVSVILLLTVMYMCCNPRHKEMKL